MLSLIPSLLSFTRKRGGLVIKYKLREEGKIIV
jgi:hypothetical protein